MKFIEKHSNELDWELISQFQKLSMNFIHKHSDKLYFKKLVFNRNLSPEVKDKLRKLLGFI